MPHNAVNIDNASFDLILSHVFDGFSSSNAQAQHVDVEGFFPQRRVSIHQTRGAQYASVVDQRVDGAEIFSDPSESLQDVFLFGQVSLESEKLSSFSLERFCEFFDSIFPSGYAYHLRKQWILKHEILHTPTCKINSSIVLSVMHS